MPDTKIFLISFNANNTFLASYSLGDSRDGIMELFEGEYMEQIQDKFYELNPPNVCNLVVFFKHHLRGGYIDSVRKLVVFFKHHSRGGYIDNILELKSKSRYDYIQECCFLGQVHGQKVFIFKMSINGVGSGISLVIRMQPIRDLQNVWIMFDHVKHVVG